jgi:hypothetical protein
MHFIIAAFWLHLWIPFFNQCHKHVLEDTTHIIKKQGYLPYSHEDVGVTVDHPHYFPELSDVFVSREDQITVHYGKQRKHGDAQTLESLRLPK